MGRGRRIIINTLLLTLSSLLMRTIGMSFQVYLTNKIGASGVGLFQLIMSVYTLFSTFAISGIRFATTRLVSEELGISPNGSITKVIRKCLIYALSFGTAATVILLFTAEPIGIYWIKDSRSVLSLRILSLSLPFLGMSAVLSGYYTAVCRVFKSAFAQLLEQLTRIAIVVAIYSHIGSSNIELSCAVIMAGGALGDVVSFSIQYIMYIFDRKRYTEFRKTRGITPRIINIAFPLALSAYARTALSTLQQLLVPYGFRKAGYSSEDALSAYGIVHGMVLPILTFPSALYYSLGEIIVPELTEAQVRGEKQKIDRIVNRTLRISTLIAFGLSVMIFRYSYEIGTLFYGIEDVGKYIRILSFVMPIMYLDSITDGLLRGLGKHLNTMWINIADSVISVALVYTLLPKWAVNGYLFMIAFTEVLNFALSMRRLSVTANVKFKFSVIAKSLFSAIGAVNIAMTVLRTCGLNLTSTPLSVTAHIILTILIYYALLKVLNCVEESDVLLFRSIFKKRQF